MEIPKHRVSLIKFFKYIIEILRVLYTRMTALLLSNGLALR